MKYITGSPRNEETEVDSEATFTALGWVLIDARFWLVEITNQSLKTI